MSRRTESKWSGQAAGTLFVAAGASLWGLIGLFTRQLSAQGFDPMEITAVRLAGAALLMAAFFLIKDRSMFRICWKDFWMFLGTGIVSFVFFNWCYFSCMEQSSLSVAAVLLYTAPSFVSVMSAVLFREKMTGRKIISLIITTAGCMLVSDIPGGSGSISAGAVFLGLGAGFGYALYSIFGRFALRKYPPQQVTFWTNICGGLGTLVLVNAPVFAGRVLQPQVIVPELLLIVFSTIAPLLLYTKGLACLETSRASILATLEPVVAAVISVAVFHEDLSWIQVIGIVLVIAAIVFSAWTPAKGGSGERRTDCNES